MVEHRAAKQKDKIIQKNGKIYIFYNRGDGRNPRYDNKPNEYKDWEDAGDNGYRIFG